MDATDANAPPKYSYAGAVDNSPAYAYDQGPSHQNFQSPQQPGFIVINKSQPQPPTVVVAQSPQPSYVAHHLLACLVLWCCNPLFGLIAFILAVVASGSTDLSEARRLAKASVIVSVVGVVVALIIVAVIVGVTASRTTTILMCNVNGIVEQQGSTLSIL